MMSLDRLVSVQDYADFARTFAGIGKASAARLSDGRRQLVQVTIAGADDIPIDPTSDLFQNLLIALRAVRRYRSAGADSIARTDRAGVEREGATRGDYQWEPVVTEIRRSAAGRFRLSKTRARSVGVAFRSHRPHAKDQGCRIRGRGCVWRCARATISDGNCRCSSGDRQAIVLRPA